MIALIRNTDPILLLTLIQTRSLILLCPGPDDFASAADAHHLRPPSHRVEARQPTLRDQGEFRSLPLRQLHCIECAKKPSPNLARGPSRLSPLKPPLFHPPLTASLEIVSTLPRPTLVEPRAADSAEDEREKLRARCEELQKKAAQQAGQLEEAYAGAGAGAGGSGLVTSAFHHHRRKSDEGSYANGMPNGGGASAARLSRWGGAMPTARFSLRGRSHQQLASNGQGGQHIRKAGSTTTSPSAGSAIDDGGLKGKNVSFHGSTRQSEGTDDGWADPPRSEDDDDDDEGRPASQCSSGTEQDGKVSKTSSSPVAAAQRAPASAQASSVADEAERVGLCAGASREAARPMEKRDLAARPGASSSMPVDESSVEQLEHLVAMQAYQLKRRSIEARSMPSEFRRAFSSGKLDTGLIAQVLLTH